MERINNKAKAAHPYLFIISSFLTVIAIGTILLLLPIATKDRHTIGFVHALFEATSAVCVTGLTVEVVAEFSMFGKVVMMILMEIGGLSFITIAVFFISILGGKLGISNRFMLREALNQSSVKGIIPLVRKIVIISFSCQLIATLINWHAFYEYVQEYTDVEENRQVIYALWVSAFHSCASFNNAGFDIFGPDSMLIFASDSMTTTLSMWHRVTINVVTMMLIFIGGIGFVVVDDVLRHVRWKKLMLHSKITLITTISLTIIGTGVLLLSSKMHFMEALFTSITTRTAGFATYDMSHIDQFPVAYMIIVMFMMIGASPCGTGGGVKTTTFAVIMIAIFNFARGKKSNKVFYRKIANDQVAKAFVLMNIAIMLVILATMILVGVQPLMGESVTFTEGLFEVVSAFSTTGLTMGITSKLCWFNDLLLCVMMLVGRLGPLTVMGLLNKNWMSNSKEEIDYVKENVIIG